MNIRNTLIGVGRGLLLSIAFLPAVWSGAVAAANLSGRSMADFAMQPILSLQSVPPLVMLTMSMDHQYWQKAYNDYTDLNNDGVVERTYSDTFEYYGYFHAQRCYAYSDIDKRFVMKAGSDGVAKGTNKHYCDGAWSGNFLNWATMTRMDVVRKVLFGGQRVVDTASQTVLERAHLPTDAHSFVKYYNGSDIAKLTPHSSLKTDTTNGGNNDGLDNADEGISICNTTYASSGSSQATTAPPLIRVAKGNFSLWSANERWQCTWQDERGTNTSSNVSAESDIYASANDPSSASELKSPGGSRDQVVRVEVCATGNFDSLNNLENCTVYGSNLKPEGLLQKYGVDGEMKFGLVTGSYQKNLSGGVLRKRISDLSDEVSTADGTFKALSATTPGIIKTLNAVRVWGYGYTNGTYLSGDSGGDNCTFQLTDILSSGDSSAPGEGKCASWGNPMSEIYTEAVRYFTATTRAPTSAFNADDSSYITGLTKDSDWTSPLTSNNACASLNTIVFNASVSSYDDDRTTPSDISIGESVASLTKKVGDGEKITGESYFIGRTGGASGTGASNNEFCTAKSISGTNALGDALGLCPEAPTIRGSYHMAGLSAWAHTNDMSSTLVGAQKLRTFAVSLQTATPVIKIPVAGGKTVSILPAYRLRKGTNNTDEAINASGSAKEGGGTLVDFKIVRPHTEVTSKLNMTAKSGTGIFNGKFYVNWEDSEQGGDFDQDMWGTIEYVLDQAEGQITVTTNAVAESTSIGQLFGFVTSGTTQDGFHAFSGIDSANFYAGSGSAAGNDPSGVKGCKTCRALSESSTDGALSGITIAVGGSGTGFTSGQTVTIVGNSSGSRNAVGTASVTSGKLTGVSRTFNGYNYRNGETLTITSATSSSAASATASANAINNQIGRQSYTFTVGSASSASYLQSPLYYAAKWGGFTDKDASKTPFVTASPGDNSEWDADGNGIPDTFYYVTDPSKLEDSLRSVFNAIIERISSGTAAAVVANEQKGNGAIFQALYDPQKKDADGNAVGWVGTLHALFVDSFGLIREDTNKNGQIDDYSTDYVVKVYFDDGTSTSIEDRRTKLIRYKPVKPDPNNPDTTDPAQFTAQLPAELTDLKTLWNARDQLASLSNSTITTQRTYSSTADTGRYIFTWLDGNAGTDPDGMVASGEVVDFVSSNLTDSNWFWLDYFNAADGDKKAGAKRLVDWVRGLETSGSTEFRTRSVDYDGVTGSRSVEAMRLGDIINSTPVAIGPPIANFDQASLDYSYAPFREKYQQRRQVVYIGANDGMLHAFNSGFYNADKKKFELKPSGSTITQHPLGSEMWAYVPRNLLPQLQWTARQDYTHVYFMDQPIRVFDVKIFPNDATHPNGWGTILVAGMRFGGGNDNTGISVDVGADGSSTNDVKTKSAYVVMDITDPEQAPTLLAEISPPNLQYTTSLPQVVSQAAPSSSRTDTTPGKWYLVFGSGPTDLADGKYQAASANPTGRKADVFVYDLSAMRTASAPSDKLGLSRTFTLSDTDVFIGDPASTDFDLDMKDEAIYFGAVGAPVAPGTSASTAVQGSLYRLLMSENSATSSWTPPEKMLSDLNRPFATQPAITVDSKYRRWVIAASGRLLVSPDKSTQNQQSLYGIIDKTFSGASVPAVTSDLVNVSNAQVFSNDRVTGVTLATGSDTNDDGAISTKELRNAVAAAGGWRKDMQITSSAPAERSANRLTVFGQVLFGSLYTPSTDLCGSDGSSRLLGLDFSTGAASLLGVFPCSNCNDPTVPLPDNISLGSGYSSSASIHFGEQTIEGKVTVITQDSRGELEANRLTTGSGDPSSEISWREYRGE